MQFAHLPEPTPMAFRLPTGTEELMLLEAAGSSLAVVLALFERLVYRLDGGAIAWLDVPVGEIDATALRMRRKILGDAVRTDVRCTCGVRVDIAFSIDEYLVHHRPVARELLPGDEPGWHRLRPGGAEFRVPCARDQLTVATAADPGAALADRCVRGGTDEHDQIEAALEDLAPDLCGEIMGVCPSCAGEVTAMFDPIDYTLGELRQAAARVYDEVCAIAHHTSWSEAEILELPSSRRARYAELATARGHG